MIRKLHQTAAQSRSVHAQCDKKRGRWQREVQILCNICATLRNNVQLLCNICATSVQQNEVCLRAPTIFFATARLSSRVLLRLRLAMPQLWWQEVHSLRALWVL